MQRERKRRFGINAIIWDWWWRWRRNVSFSLSLCISISLLRLYTFFSRSHSVSIFSYLSNHWSFFENFFCWISERAQTQTQSESESESLKLFWKFFLLDFWESSDSDSVWVWVWVTEAFLKIFFAGFLREQSNSWWKKLDCQKIAIWYLFAWAGSIIVLSNRPEWTEESIQNYISSHKKTLSCHCLATIWIWPVVRAHAHSPH